jgi:hypothetical protein
LGQRLGLSKGELKGFQVVAEEAAIGYKIIDIRFLLF